MPNVWGRFFKDVGVDLGTATTLVYVRDRGLAVNEPSVAAVNNKTNRILAVGEDAKKMLGRTPAHISVIRPLVGCVVSDFEMTREILQHFLGRLRGTVPLASVRRAIIAIPDDLTEVARKSVEDAALSAGCARVYLVEQPVAAALGVGLPIDTPSASMIVDIGGGTTDIAVISLGGTVVSKTLKIAGDKMNDDIVRYVRDEFKLVIGEPTAEAAKIAAGSAVTTDERLEVPIRGRDIATGLPREVVLKNNHVRAAIAKSLRGIIDAAREVIELTPPELAGDMLRQGITLCGGGAELRGMAALVEKETAVRTEVAEDPSTCVVRGLGRIVDDHRRYRELLNNPLRPLDLRL